MGSEKRRVLMRRVLMLRRRNKRNRARRTLRWVGEKAENGKGDLFKKLKLWEKEDRVESVGNTSIKPIRRLDVLNSRLDMLLGSMITTLVFFLCFLVLQLLE